MPNHPVQLDEESWGQRLDQYLAAKFGLSRSQIQKAIKDGQVLINGRPAKSSRRLEEGDRIETVADLSVDDSPTELAPRPDLAVPVIHEEDDFLVVDKPSGLTMHPATPQDQDTLANALLARYPEIKTVGESIWRPGIMQRLDKDASGLVVIARNPAAYDKLKRQFQEHTVRKEYLALVNGQVAQDSGRIDLAVGRAKDGRRMSARPKLKEKDREALTHYEVAQRFQKATLLRVRTETGRTHQIRVHFKAIGHPLVGDALYGNRSGLVFSRLFLHASRLGFRRPSDSQPVEFESPLPPRLARLLEELTPAD